MFALPPRAPSLHELLLRSDFGRLNPQRVRDLLDRAADPLMEDRNGEGRDEQR